ncbi:MAG: nucleotidyltransferase [Bacteroidetes bacterium]|nr:MAG: nucleotidyltransferase [Bacteroidota bacterium]
MGAIAKQRNRLKDKYSVTEIGIFGSYVRGEQDRGSDVDIVVDFVELPDLLNFLELERYLERIIKRKVDLVRKGAIRKELKNQILKEVIYL